VQLVIRISVRKDELGLPRTGKLVDTKHQSYQDNKDKEGKMYYLGIKYKVNSNNTKSVRVCFVNRRDAYLKKICKGIYIPCVYINKDGSIFKNRPDPIGFDDIYLANHIVRYIWIRQLMKKMQEVHYDPKHYGES